MARLLLALLLVCNLTLCVSMHGPSLSFDGLVRSSIVPLTHAKAMPNHHMSALQLVSSDAKPDALIEAPHSANRVISSCHQGNETTTSADSCKMQSGTPSGTNLLPLFGMLLSLFILPLLLLPLGTASSVLDNWLRDPFLRSRGSHPPSWPRRHLMLSVLRH